MNIDELTLGQLREIKALLGARKCRAKTADPDIGKYVIVRTYSAGVHCGTLVSRNGLEVRLSNARRIWNWQSDSTKRYTLHEVSLHGVAANSKVSAVVESHTSTEAIEVIPCTAAAATNLQSSKWTA